MTLFRVVLVFVGSGVGGMVRYLFGTFMLALTGPGFPYGTVTINAVGSFCISFIMGLGAAHGAETSTELRLALTTGLMGGFTTYSAFNYESVALVHAGVWPIALANVGVTVVVCLGLGFLGLWAGRLF